MKFRSIEGVTHFDILCHEFPEGLQFRVSLLSFIHEYFLLADFRFQRFF